MQKYFRATWWNTSCRNSWDASGKCRRIPASNVSARHAADKTRQKYKNVRKNKAIKLAKLKGNEQVIAKNTDRKRNLQKVLK